MNFETLLKKAMELEKMRAMLYEGLEKKFSLKQYRDPELIKWIFYLHNIKMTKASSIRMIREKDYRGDGGNILRRPFGLRQDTSG